MYGRYASTGRLLGSTALRYRQPLCAPGRGVAAADRTRRWLSPGGLGLGGADRGADQLPVANGPTARTAGLARLEAILFLARQPQGSRKLAQLVSLADGTRARTLVRALNRLYDAEGSAFRVEEVAGGFQLMTRSKFARWLRRAHGARVEVRLSAPAMETLAVVAYRQPVLRADIEAIRGVQCGEILRQLIERDLVRIVGRSEELGRPFLYGTTKQFLQVFGLRHLDELPRRGLFRAAEPVLQDVGMEPSRADEADKETSNQPNYSQKAEEETDVKTLTPTQSAREEFAEAQSTAAAQPERNELPDQDVPPGDHDDEEQYDDGELDDYDEDDEDDDDLEEDEELEDEEEFEDQPWEEVGDDGEEEEEEDEDDDWDEDEDWDEEDWDEDEDE